MIPPSQRGVYRPPMAPARVGYVYALCEGDVVDDVDEGNSGDVDGDDDDGDDS